jgi:serine/threonine protein kinase
MRLGPYEIVALLGAGGMGQVYRARDTNLGRDVALKTLPDTVTHDPERLARFRREAQLLAALNHPHIGSIYGLEETNGQRFLVLELVEGETLAARIQRGPLPVNEALAIAREITDALQSAHDRGIIHRDLKPANIALTMHDRVKVLDFGLAKATDAAVPESWRPRDGVFLFSATKDTETTLWTFSIRDRKASRFGDVISGGLPTNAVFSPDGRWVAYQEGAHGSGAEGTTFVQPFPATGAKYQIARGGRPMWSRDGTELFFVPAPSLFMVVSVRTDPVFGFTAPVPVPRRFGLAAPGNPRPYDILPDGRIVSIDTVNPAGDRLEQLTVVLNWFEELKARVTGAK